MSKIKKLFSLMLALLMLTTMMASCGKGGEQSSTESEESSSSQSQSSEKTSGGEDEDSEATGLTGINRDEEVELVWYVGGSGPQADTPLVLEEVNKYLKDKINVKLKIVETDFGNFTDKMQMVIAGQEEFDLCYTAHWCNNFYNNVNKNAFIELDELLDAYAPELKALIPENGWEAVKVDGKIMAVPNYQIWAMTNGIEVETSYVDEYKFDMSAVKTLGDIEPLLEKIKADNPNMYPLEHSKGGVLDFLTYVMGYDELAGRHITGVVMLESNDLKVINQFELPQVQEHYKLMHEWNKKGYFRQDAATVTDTTADSMAGKHPISLSGTIKPGMDVSLTIAHGGRPVKAYPISDSWLTTSGITATMTAVSRTSKHPDRAMDFLNLFNTDEYLYNLITKGIEGKHYEKLDDGFIRFIDGSGYYPNADWMYGNQFLAYMTEGQGKNDWAETIVMNQNAKPSPALGFTFNPEPVQTEIASVSAVVKEFELTLDTGSGDTDKLMEEFLTKLEQAGSGTVMDEIQRQLDAWAASR